MKLRFDFEGSILFQDDDYVFVNKPPFISTLEDRNDPVNILQVARDFLGDAQVCHRLDKDTSGVLAIAKNPEAYRHLSIQLEDREVTKVYHAIVDGIHDFKEVLVDAPILKQNDGTVKISRTGKSAQTWFTTLKTLGSYTLVECRPVTGRMHQIRIHLAARLGASIAGDDLYGGKPVFLSKIKRGYNLAKNTEEEPLIRRMALHAFSFEFLDMGGKKVKVEAPYPKDFRVLLKQLTDNGR
ncbi:MAG TPA: RluA family pseudouridine synthase [Cyclobacteriaceae bacterium]|nr:RluA family pseudouridine synthase [Cyclobacteriaceae bacterium]